MLLTPRPKGAVRYSLNRSKKTGSRLRGIVSRSGPPVLLTPRPQGAVHYFRNRSRKIGSRFAGCQERRAPDLQDDVRISRAPTILA